MMQQLVTALGRIKHPHKRAMLETVSRSGNILVSARSVGIDRVTHYRWLKNDKAYAMAYEMACEDFADTLVAEATRRAVHGVEEPVFFQGVQCGTIRRYSDLLMDRLLRIVGRLKDKYEVSGTQTVQHEVIFRVEFDERPTLTPPMIEQQ